MPQNVIDNLVPEETKTVEGIDFHIKRFYIDGHIYKEIDFEDNGKKFHFTEKVQALTLPDFETMMESAGIHLLDVFGDYKLRKFSKKDSRTTNHDFQMMKYLIPLLAVLAGYGFAFVLKPENKSQAKAIAGFQRFVFVVADRDAFASRSLRISTLDNLSIGDFYHGRNFIPDRPRIFLQRRRTRARSRPSRNAYNSVAIVHQPLHACIS